MKGQGLDYINNMTIKDLKDVLNNESQLKDLDFEDYNGNTIGKLSNMDLADIEIYEESGMTARLQSNI